MRTAAKTQHSPASGIDLSPLVDQGTQIVDTVVRLLGVHFSLLIIFIFGIATATRGTSYICRDLEPVDNQWYAEESVKNIKTISRFLF